MSRDDYEERQKRRKDRLLERASRTSGEAKAAYAAAGRIAKHRPLGQTIIAGPGRHVYSAAEDAVRDVRRKHVQEAADGP